MGGNGEVKDTLANLRDCPEMVVHIVDYELRNKMNAWRARFRSGRERGGDRRFHHRHLRLWSTPPRITDCRVQLGKANSSIFWRMGTLPYYMILGEVVHFHMDDAIINERLHIDPGALDALGRMAGNGGYTRITDKFEMPFLHPPGSVPPRRGRGTRPGIRQDRSRLAVKSKSQAKEWPTWLTPSLAEIVYAVVHR